MTGRERIEAALSPTGSAEVPAAICYEDLYARDRWDEVTSCPWWYRVSPCLEHQYAWHRRLIELLGQDWFMLPTCHSREERERLSLEEGASGVALVDATTGERREVLRQHTVGWESSVDAAPVHPERPAKSPEEIDRQLPVATGRTDTVADGRGDLAARLLAEFGDRLCPYRASSSPLWHTFYLWGFEGMMQMIVCRPDLVAYACERYLELMRRGVHESARLGARVIFVQEALADAVSPHAFAALAVPYMRALVDEIHALGLRSVYYYTGRPTDRWDEILAVGADALWLEESKKGFEVDIVELAACLQGACSLFGNMDPVTVLQDGHDGLLRGEVERQCRAAEANRGRFVAAPGSPVTPRTPLARVRRFCDLVHELG